MYYIWEEVKTINNDAETCLAGVGWLAEFLCIIVILYFIYINYKQKYSYQLNLHIQ